MTIAKVNRATYLRPELTGGDEPPKGFKWVVYSLPVHHMTVIDCLAMATQTSTSKALRLLIDTYLEEHRAEINEAFKLLKERKEARRATHE